MTATSIAAERLLTISDLAEHLGISKASIYRYRSEGKNHLLPPAIQIGTHPRWRHSTVQEWLEAREGKGSDD